MMAVTVWQLTIVPIPVFSIVSVVDIQFVLKFKHMLGTSNICQSVKIIQFYYLFFAIYYVGKRVQRKVLVERTIIKRLL